MHGRGKPPQLLLDRARAAAAAAAKPAAAGLGLDCDSARSILSRLKVTLDQYLDLTALWVLWAHKPLNAAGQL